MSDANERKTNMDVSTSQTIGSERSGTNAERTMPNRENSSEELMSRTIINDTDFELVGSDEFGYWVAMGRFRLTDPKPTKEEAFATLEREFWKITVKVAAIVHETLMADTARALEQAAKEHFIKKQ